MALILNAEVGNKKVSQFLHFSVVKYFCVHLLPNEKHF